MKNDILDFLCPTRFGSTSNLLNWVREKSTSALETGKEKSHSKFCHVDILYFVFIIPVNTIFEYRFTRCSVLLSRLCKISNPFTSFLCNPF